MLSLSQTLSAAFTNEVLVGVAGVSSPEGLGCCCFLLSFFTSGVRGSGFGVRGFRGLGLSVHGCRGFTTSRVSALGSGFQGL